MKKGIINMSNQPKMTRQQAITIWNSLSQVQKVQFNELLEKMQKGELMLNSVNVDDNETIQNIILEPKEKRSLPTAPYAKHFHLEDL
jgi:hypothetical protein